MGVEPQQLCQGVGWDETIPIFLNKNMCLLFEKKTVNVLK